MGIYVGFYAITNNYCVVHARNDFYLPATLILVIKKKPAGGKISELVVDGNYSVLHELGFPSCSCCHASDWSSTGTGLLGHRAVYFWDICELFFLPSGQTQLSSTLKTSKSKD